MSPVLLDTSVWRRHFSGKLTQQQASWIATLLDEDGIVLMHPWVIGELVLGGLSAKEEALLHLMKSATAVDDADVLGFIQHRRLSQRGIGWVDAQLLASALTHSALLWAIDKDLESVADELKVRFQGPQ